MFVRNIHNAYFLIVHSFVFYLIHYLGQLLLKFLE
jgi:hypothetical protein